MALSLVSGILKLRGRIDRAVAEKSAFRADLVLPPFTLRLPPDPILMARSLRTMLARPIPPGAADPLEGDRSAMQRLVDETDPDEGELLGWMLQYFPEDVTFETLDPSGDFARKLIAQRSDLDVTDRDIIRATFYLAPGGDLREQSLPWQLATSVVNVLAGLAVEHQSLLIRDKQAREIIASVLERFAAPDLAGVGSGRQLLQFALGATLNGALDVRDALAGDKAWLGGILSALAEARAASGNGNDYVLGLLSGKGYRDLVSTALAKGAVSVSGDGASAFGKIAAEMLKSAAPLVRKSTNGFDDFFRDHWADLLGAGLNASLVYGDTVLGRGGPFEKVILQTVTALAEQTDGRAFLSTDTFAAVVEAAIGAVAGDEALLDDAKLPGWLREVLGSVVAVVGMEGPARAFSAEGLERILHETLGVLSRHPHLLGRQPRLIEDLVGALLEALSASPGLRLEDLAEAGVHAVLDAVSNHPALLDTPFGATVAALAGDLAAQARDQRLTEQNVSALLTSAVHILSTHPALLAVSDSDDPRVRAVVTFVRLLTGGDLTTLLDGPSLDEVVRAALETVAQQPALLSSGYGKTIADLAAALSAQLSDDTSLGSIDVRALLQRAVHIIGRNPALLARADGLAAGAVTLVIKLLSEVAGGQIAGRRAAEVIGGVLEFLARYGTGLMDSGGVEMLLRRLEATLRPVLLQAISDIGKRLSLDEVPAVVLVFLEKWARGRVASLDATVASFQTIFDEALNEVLSHLNPIG